MIELEIACLAILIWQLSSFVRIVKLDRMAERRISKTLRKEANGIQEIQ